jgi:predicted enzyme related to lactoylglutathione lyase
MADTNPSATFGFMKLWVSDLDRATLFYEQTLGWAVERTVDLPHVLETLLHGPGQEPRLALCQSKTPREITIGNGWGPALFYVTDADAIYARALAHGGKASREPFDVADLRVAFFFDPEGYEIELVAQRGWRRIGEGIGTLGQFTECSSDGASPRIALDRRPSVLLFSPSLQV